MRHLRAPYADDARIQPRLLLEESRYSDSQAVLLNHIMSQTVIRTRSRMKNPAGMMTDESRQLLLLNQGTRFLNIDLQNRALPLVPTSYRKTITPSLFLHRWKFRSKRPTGNPEGISTNDPPSPIRTRADSFGTWWYVTQPIKHRQTKMTIIFYSRQSKRSSPSTHCFSSPPQSSKSSR